jgi:lipoprotein-anchoring transpeptidase ErfK/SrfK
MLWTLAGGALAVLLAGAVVLALGMGVLVLVGSERILPGVSAAGLALGSQTVENATAQLESAWAEVTVRDGDRTWTVPAAQLGLALDAGATAQAAQRRGRGDGSILTALIGHDEVAPDLSVDPARAAQGIKALASTVDVPPSNATIRIVNGQLTPVAAVEGRTLDVTATLNRLLADPGGEMADGALNLSMNTAVPSVMDASALMAQASSLLAAPLTINAFDPVLNQTVPWSVPPDQWGQWLTTENGPAGPWLTLDPAGLGQYLNQQNATLTDARYLDVDKSLAMIQAAITAGKSTATVRVYHRPTRYTVAPGDTLGTLAWKFGIPMWRLVDANRGVNMDALSLGQTIIIPSKDDLLPLPIIDNKRIVVSISKQHMWVYENGQLKWDWIASTGISDSPTMPGVFQIQSHEKNAYAGNWDLWMPNFMGIYDAVPGFTNGIHGFPSRGGYQILWQNSLGHPVTYGCILISSQNAEQLYNWAENGVVVEIQG